MPEPEKPLLASHCFALGRQVMSTKTIFSGADALGSITQAAYANTVSKLGALFLTGLQHIYAAHMEKAQMRFAPRPVRCNHAIKRQHPFGL
jgi:hypothetical protein